MTQLQLLLSQMNARHAQVKSIWDTCDHQRREPSASEQSDIKQLNSEVAELNKRASNLPEGAALIASKQLGQAILHSPEFKQWFAQLRAAGQPGSAPFTSPAIAVPLSVKSLLNSVSGATSRADFYTEVPALASLVPPLTVRDIVSHGTTESDIVTFTQIASDAYDNNAAPTAEATATAGGSGAAAESGIVFQSVDAPVRSISHWIPASKNALSDASMFESLVNTLLILGIESELDRQMIAGDGTGENLLGIQNASVPVQAFDTSIRTTLRKARTLVAFPGHATPNAYILDPRTVETLDLPETHYTGMVGGVGQAHLFGLPIIENPAVGVTRAIVGDFRYAMLWDRLKATVRVSNEHSDFYVRNMIAILAELRAAFGLLYPDAFVDAELS